MIDSPFAVINADDYYGREAFITMKASLDTLSGQKASMVAYALENTVSEHGTVTRGLCTTDMHGHLVGVTETYKIGLDTSGAIRDFASSPEGVLLPRDAMASMNFWGFTPWLFEEGDKALRAFLSRQDLDPLKAEYVLPTLVNDLMKHAGMTVDVLRTNAVWFGMTYREDRPLVVAHLRDMHEKGFYPEHLWN